MADPAEVLDALDFSVLVLCSSLDCFHRATDLVGCSTPGCSLKWAPACSSHMHATLSTQSAAICSHCGTSGALSQVLTSRPL